MRRLPATPSQHRPAFTRSAFTRLELGEPGRVAVLVRPGIDRAQAESLLQQLERAGHDAYVLGPRLGAVLCADGTRLAVDASLRRWPVERFDRVFVLPCAGPLASLTAEEAAFTQRTGRCPVPVKHLPWPHPAEALLSSALW